MPRIFGKTKATSRQDFLHSHLDIIPNRSSHFSIMERKMRRFRQELSGNESLEILKRGKVAVMAVAGDDDYPYAIPLNYVYDNGYVYLNSA